MNVSQAEFQNMKEEIVKDLISRLMDERGLSMEQAFDIVYTSRLFEKLNDPKTGLFFQSSGYVYSYLTEELQSITAVPLKWASRSLKQLKHSLLEEFFHVRRFESVILQPINGLLYEQKQICVRTIG